MGPDLDAAIEAARRYRSIGALAEELLRPDIYRAWERCHALRTNPQQARAEALDARETDLLIAHRAPLLAAATPYVRALSQASGEHAHQALLGDAHGVVIAAVGHASGASTAPGSLLDEASSGANGVGTPLAESSYMEIVGPEHFIEGFREWTCQGIPLQDGAGNVVGVLSTSVRSAEVSRRLREMLLCAARGIEVELLHASLEVRLAGVLAEPNPSREVLERLHQDLIQKHASARMRVELASEQLGHGLTLSAADVMKLALRALETYRRQAAFWRALASPEGARPPAPVALDEAARDLVILLDGEAAAHDCEIRLREIEPATVLADPGALRASLLRSALAALALGRGGSVFVDVRRERDQGVLSLSPSPGPFTQRRAAAPITVGAPIC